MTRTRRATRGFTLIELLVVITIIGLLTSTILSSLSNARAKAKDARRVSDLRSIRNALEQYNDTNGSYPNTGGSIQWRSQCSTWGSYAANNVIPGLVPQYLPSMPADPDMDAAGNTCCYLYTSNGTNYKLLVNNCTAAVDFARFPNLYDPRRDGCVGGSCSNCAVDGNAPWTLAVYTNGACTW